MNEAEFDALLAETLAPPQRPVDAAFVARVDRAVLESERYRRWRANLWRQLAGELLALGALAASLVAIGQVPDVRTALAEAPTAAWPALLSLIMLWLLVTRQRPGALA
jgi:hypothetical protein